MGIQNAIRICLTIDVESDYGRSGRYALLDQANPFFEWVRGEQIPFTAFITGRLLEQGHPVIESFQSADIPIGVHGYEHRTDRFGTMTTSHEDEIRRGIEAYVKRIGRPPAGYRAPLGIVSRDDIALLARQGLRYDASIFPVRRPGRYDFSAMPRTPFRWDGTSLVEMPFGLLTKTLPAGMSFINLVGPAMGSTFLRRQCRARSDSSATVVDMHFHNLFTDETALRDLPLGLRAMYRAGAWRNGISCLKALVGNLRRAGAVFGCLETDALNLKTEALPVAGFDRCESGI